MGKDTEPRSSQMLCQCFPESLPPSCTQRPKPLTAYRGAAISIRVNLNRVEWDGITYDMIRLTLDQKPYLLTQAPEFADLICSILHTLYSKLNMTPWYWKQTASSPWSLRVQLQSQKKKMESCFKTDQ